MKYQLIALLLLFLAGCDSKHDPIRTLNDGLDAVARKTQRELGALAPDNGEAGQMAAAEVEKLFTFEYKVVSLSHAQSDRQLETALNQLGQDRWECFQVIQTEDGNSLVCKRAPKSYLRYIPRFMP